ATPEATPFHVPKGYSLRETHRTNPDGSTELIRETIPIPSISTPIPEPAVARQTPPPPASAHASERRSLPDWLTANRRRIKASLYLTATVGATALGVIYGPEIAAGVSAGATAVGRAALTVLKVIGIGVAVGLGLRFAFGGGGGSSKRNRTGTFEGTLKGTWRED
ncbi:hypothetical protein, partial [Streptomyces javensis]